MKSHVSRVLALGVLVCVSVTSWAQPPAVAPPEPSDPSPTAFYDKMRHAGSYRGHLVATKTRLNGGKVVELKRLEIQSSWIGDIKREGFYKNSAENIIFTVTSQGKITVEKFSNVDDGIIAIPRGVALRVISPPQRQRTGWDYGALRVTKSLPLSHTQLLSDLL